MESEKSFNFRIKRFASHIDGIIPLGSKKRRFAKEYHAFILGLPIMNNFKNNASMYGRDPIKSLEIFLGIYMKVYLVIKYLILT